jgi:hypothetical protein
MAQPRGPTPSAIRHQYFEWLVLQIGDAKIDDIHPVCTIMHQKEFVWFVANDDNRIQDALDLRLEFLYEENLEVPSDALRLVHVSVLEVLVALSRRMEFFVNGRACDWAWVLMEHLGLHKYRGHLTNRRRDNVDQILEKLVWRQYEADGSGGFFPLAWPNEDQTKVEIWYQLQNWIGEQHPM